MTDGWAVRPLQPTHPTQPMYLSYHTSEKPFASVILSVMPVTQNIKSQHNPLSANNVKTHYNWSPVAPKGLIHKRLYLTHNFKIILL